MDKVDFWGLERPVQERFVESAKGAGAPAPLAVRPLAVDPRTLGWGGLGLGSLIAVILTLRLGYGDLTHRYALTPIWFCVVYGGLFALSAFGFLKAAARHVSAHAVPYRPALYLFPIGVIDARAPTFAVHRVSEHTQVSVAGGRRVRISLGDGDFEFATPDASLAEQAAQAITELRDRLANAGPDSSAREQSLVDPLVDNGFKNPFSPTESMKKALPMWVKVWPMLAVILGVLLGGAAWRVRNTLSEARLYAAARKADRSEAYRAYLARGGKNPDVAAVLLPRAELHDATAKGNVAAVEQFIETHPDTKIKPEIDNALHQALLKELSAAEALGTLTALNDFSSRYARYAFLAPDLEAATNARIAAALAQLRPALASNQSRLLPFIERLLRYTAKHGSEVDVRFQRKPTETLDKAEKILHQSAYFTGPKSLPGQYFDPAHAAPREDATAAALIAALAEHLPKDFVEAKAAPPVEDSPEPPKPSVPTLLISYHTEMSGAFQNRKPRLALSGIGLLCKASFDIPGDSDPLTFKLSVWRAPEMSTFDDSTTPAAVYETMATDAFKKFTKKYLATVFAEH